MGLWDPSAWVMVVEVRGGFSEVCIAIGSRHMFFGVMAHFGSLAGLRLFCLFF